MNKPLHAVRFANPCCARLAAHGAPGDFDEPEWPLFV